MYLFSEFDPFDEFIGLAKKGVGINLKMLIPKILTISEKFF